MRVFRTFYTFNAAVAAAYAASPTPIVDLGYAKYQGSVNNQTGNLEFLGIRYAAPPTGSLRWKEPQAPETTPDVQQADHHPPICYQGFFGLEPKSPYVKNNGTLQKRADEEPAPSEDCLFLSVVTPASNNGSLPVVVWIHGGGYQAGSGFQYDGNDLIPQSGNGTVTVVIQYRIGVFGFLPGQKVHDGGALNVGLLDQQFALKWVQEHISLFGGDPSKVTIWGESAGAGSVLQHVIANDGNTQPSLFRAAITSSSFLPSQYAYNDRVPEILFTQVANGTGCSNETDALECLRQVDVNILQQVNVEVSNATFYGTFIFVPVVDGDLITERPTQLLKKGKVNGEAFLGVTNANEGFAFVLNTSVTTTEEYIHNLFPEFTEEQINAGAAQYSDLGMPFVQSTAVMSEAIFVCPTYFLLRAFGDKGFKGEFAVPPALHGFDLPHYFPNTPDVQDLPPELLYNNTEFTNNFAQSFLNFAMNLDPNVKWDSSNTLPEWSRWSDSNGRTEMLFNRTETMEPVFKAITTPEDLIKRCEFWESVGEFSGQ